MPGVRSSWRFPPLFCSDPGTFCVQAPPMKENSDDVVQAVYFNSGDCTQEKVEKKGGRKERPLLSAVF